MKKCEHYQVEKVEAPGIIGGPRTEILIKDIWCAHPKSPKVKGDIGNLTCDGNLLNCPIHG